MTQKTGQCDAGIGQGASLALDQCASLGTFTPPGQPGALGSYLMVDWESKLVLASSPKAGATVALQMLLRYTGQLDMAESKSGWVHDYEEDLIHQPAHDPSNFSASVCAPGSTQATCVKLVRSPLDRAVSSFLVVSGAEGNPRGPRMSELPDVLRQTGRDAAADDILGPATFVDFLDALELRGCHAQATFPADPTFYAQGDTHFLPQATPADENEAIAPHVLYVPVEALDKTINHLKSRGVALDSSSLSSSHYKVKVDYIGDASRLDAASLKPLILNATTPSYDAFLRDKSTARRVCCLFHSDVELYRRTCAQPWLRECAACREACDATLADIENHCSLPMAGL